MCCPKTDDREFLELSSVFLSLRIQSEFSRLTSEQMEEKSCDDDDDVTEPLLNGGRNGPRCVAEWAERRERESAEMGQSGG